MMITDMASQNTFPTNATNGSSPEGCITFRFSQMNNLPSNNPVSKEVLSYIAKARTNLVVILFLIGGPANIINMAVFYKQSLKDRVNLLLFSLSLTDELSLIAVVLHYVEAFYFQFTGKTQMGPLFVKLVNSRSTVLQSFTYVSFFLSAMIACERCCCVVWPLKYKTLLRTRTLALIIVAVYVAVPGLFFISLYKYYIVCVYDPDTGVVSNVFIRSKFYHRHKDLVDYTNSVLFGAGLTTGIMIVVVTATIVTASKLRQALTWRTETGSSSISLKEVALTKILIGTSVLFIVCVSPACLRRVASLIVPELNTGGRYEKLFLMLIHISQVFVSINLTPNFFIYYVMSSRYRQTFRILFTRKPEQKKNMM